MAHVIGSMSPEELQLIRNDGSFVEKLDELAELAEDRYIFVGIKPLIDDVFLDETTDSSVQEEDNSDDHIVNQDDTGEDEVEGGSLSTVSPDSDFKHPCMESCEPGHPPHR